MAQNETCTAVPQDKIDSCKQSGGVPTIMKDSAGCEYLASCDQQPTSGGGGGSQSCAEIPQSKYDECYKQGGTPNVMKDSSGCPFVSCKIPTTTSCDPDISDEITACKNEGGYPTTATDSSGCEYFKSCERTLQCTPIPQQKYDECNKMGGYIVTIKDNNGCEYAQECRNTATCPAVTPARVEACTRVGQVPQYAKDSSGCEYMTGCYVPQQACQEIQPQIDKCNANNGRLNIMKDNMGCEYIECTFATTPSYPTTTAVACPTPENNDAVAEKCKAMSLNPTWTRDMNGCAYVTCQQSTDPCEAIRITSEVKDAMIKGCGGSENVASYIDQNGCQVLTCKGQTGCIEITSDMKITCEKKGGYLVTKEENGCVYTAECVERGSDTSITYAQKEGRKEISATDLLELALKLENLKVKIDELAQTCRKLGAYYDGTGDKDQATKFRTVAGMFYGINTKIDDVKDKIRSRMGNLGESDMDEIQHDILYIKEVAIKDIVWVLLGTGKELSTQTDCGMDQDCFKRALRLCQPAVMSQGDAGKMMTAKISGLDGTACTMVMELKEGGNAYAMTCTIPDYVNGEILPQYCTGELAERLTAQPTTATQSASVTTRPVVPEVPTAPGSAYYTLELAKGV